MLKTIDWYIIKKFLGAFFFTSMLFSLISTIVDFSDKVDKFVKASMSAKQIWIDYYLNFIPYINGILWPLFSLIAVIFITSRLARNAEVISILNAGVSYRRFLRPFLFSALFIATLHFLGNHFLIPRSNSIRYSMDANYLGKNKETGKYRDVHVFFNDDSKIYVRNYFKADSSARVVRLEKLKDGELVGYIKANRMKLKTPPNTWTLEGAQRRAITSMREEHIEALPAKFDTTINVFPSDFTFRKHDKDGMTTPALLEAIRKEELKGAGNTSLFSYELHRRTSEPFTIIILTLIGVAIASRKVRGGMGLHLALGVLIGAAYIFISKFAFTFATSDIISPFIAVWIPNILFSCIAIYLVANAQK